MRARTEAHIRACTQAHSYAHNLHTQINVLVEDAESRKFVVFRQSKYAIPGETLAVSPCVCVCVCVYVCVCVCVCECVCVHIP